MSLDPQALDRYLTGGRYARSTETVYCWNTVCAFFSDTQEVIYGSEYGGGWYTPEECPGCGSEWHEEPPD